MCTCLWVFHRRSFKTDKIFHLRKGSELVNRPNISGHKYCTTASGATYRISRPGGNHFYLLIFFSAISSGKTPKFQRGAGEYYSIYGTGRLLWALCTLIGTHLNNILEELIPLKWYDNVNLSLLALLEFVKLQYFSAKNTAFLGRRNAPPRKFSTNLNWNLRKRILWALPLT